MLCEHANSGSMNPQRQALLTAVVQYSTQNGALPLGQVQRVADYSTAAGQLTYVENYLPKQLGCWRYVRRRLQPQQLEHPTISIGAGPRLCLWGWFFDLPPPTATVTRAIDVLDWSVTRAAPFAQAEQDVFGGATLRVETGLHFPEDFASPQCMTVPGIKPLLSAMLAEPSWILFPFLFGHMLDKDGKILVPQMALMGRRIRQLVTDGHTLIVVDKAAGSVGTNWFWSDLVEKTLGYSVPPAIPVFDFRAEAAEFAPCYQNPMDGAYRIKTTSASGFWMSQQEPAPHWIT
jgi:hypothetical protein